MSSERERFLEVRGLLPPVHEQLRLRAVAQRLARDVCQLEGEERKRNVALEAKYRQLAARARAGERITWPVDE